MHITRSLSWIHQSLVPGTPNTVGTIDTLVDVLQLTIEADLNFTALRIDARSSVAAARACARGCEW
ncbi:hypothetical protein [Cupriavidus sp. DL-D2]|uniref:hypothetical protein n=1 Tax=Cupriavidus sp. DL-D2 TaxID=3144974 RepID=UPI0032135BE6